MVTNIKLNDGKYIATFEICDNNEDYSICNLGQKLTNDVIQVNKTFIDIDIYKSQMEEKDQRIAELEQDLEFTTKTANELIVIKHKLEQQLEEKDKEIERLKFFEKAYYYNQLQASQEDIQKFQQLANQNAININYIAIQELEKVKNFVDGRTYCADYINKRIQELKGEK